MAYAEEARTRARRRRFRRDLDVFMALQPGSLVCVLWVSSDWDPYGGDPATPHKRELLYEVVEGPDRRGASYTAELRPAAGIAKRYAHKWAQLRLRAEEDAPRKPDGSIDYSRAGGVNTAILVFRQSGRDTPLASGGWVHLRAVERVGQMELLFAARA